MRLAWNSSNSAIFRPQRGRRGLTPAKRAATPHYKRGEKIQAVQSAKRKEEKRKEEHMQTYYPYVFVGNLKPSITKQRLQDFFAHCGTVHHIEIRCSRGQAITAGIPVPEDRLTSRDRQYASIEFTSPKAARLSLRLHGRKIDGCEIVVSRTPADLPEVRDIVSSRLEKICESQGLSNPLRSKAGPIVGEATEEVFETPQSDRHRLFGFSFAKCVA